MTRISILKALTLSAVAAIVSVSCGQVDPDTKEQTLEVTAHNISGKWMLETWNNVQLEEGTYVYLDIVRNDRTYTMYQNFDSFSNAPHIITGSYHIDTDPELGAIIRGNYDHDSGDWAHRYIVTSLTADDMVWTAKDDPEYIQHYTRVESIPVE